MKSRNKKNQKTMKVWNESQKSSCVIALITAVAMLFFAACDGKTGGGSVIGNATFTAIDCNEPESVYAIVLSDPIKPAMVKQKYYVRKFLDKNGFIKEYSLTLKTGICYDNVCKPIHVNVHWDMLGRFLRLECPKYAPLTKKEHEPFTARDYARLDEILRDRLSILKRIDPSFFYDVNKKENQIHAITFATPISLQNAVVKGAAHTSWALWHWVNGEVVDKLLDLTRLSCDTVFLHHCLSSPDDREMVKFALEFILKNDPKNAEFHDAAFNILKKAGRKNCQLALEYLKDSMPDKDRLNQQLVKLMSVNGGSERLISNYITAQPQLSTAILERLAGKLSRLSYHDFHAVFKLLESRQGDSAAIKSKISELLQSDDPYRVKYARDYLEKQK